MKDRADEERDEPEKIQYKSELSIAIFKSQDIWTQFKYFPHVSTNFSQSQTIVINLEPEKIQYKSELSSEMFNLNQFNHFSHVLTNLSQSQSISNKHNQICFPKWHICVSEF